MANKKQRISGTKLHEKAMYTVQEGGAWHADIGAVRRCMEAYLNQAAKAGKYSLAGLCIALRITREKLILWRKGYFCEQDMVSANVLPNAALAECVEMGILHLQRHWEESEKPSSLHIKQLESTGALGEGGPPSAKPPFDLGRLKKFAQ